MNDGRERRPAVLFVGLLPMSIHKVLAATVVPSAPAYVPFLCVDDVLVACVVGLVCARRSALVRRVAVVVLVAWLVVAQLSVQALGMPFLPSMLAGCDAAMQDSLGPYCTLGNGARIAALLAAVVPGRLLDRRWPQRPARLVCLGALAAVVSWLGPNPAHPSQRNPLVAFVRQLLPRSPDLGGLPAPASEWSPAAASTPDLHGIARGRSVVLVVLESAGHRAVDPCAASPSAMPFLRELARAGLHCPTTYAVYPESIEGQVPILCGLPPRVDAAPTDYGVHARSALPHRLRELGYRSGLFHAGRFRFLGMQDVLQPMGFDTLADAAVIGGEVESSFGIDEEATIDALLRWVQAQPPRQNVLACWLPIAGHHPYASPPGGPFPATTPIDCWRNALHYADRSLQRLWTGLCALRPPEHWLLCVVGDHGQAFGEHAGNFGHSFELYEENVRVPLLFMAPGTPLAGRRHAAACSHLDVVPTLLDLLGVPVANSLLRAQALAPDVFAFTDWGELQVMCRRGRWKLLHEIGTDRSRLFDLQQDPEERQDLAATTPETTAQLRAAALAFLAGTSTAHAR